MPNSARRNRLKRHACIRARERWGAALTLEDVGMLNVIIRMGLGRPIQKPGSYRQSKRKGRKLFVTTLDWVRLPVVFDDKYNCIVTVLPPDAREVIRALRVAPGQR